MGGLRKRHRAGAVIAALLLLAAAGCAAGSGAADLRYGAESAATASAGADGTPADETAGGTVEFQFSGPVAEALDLLARDRGAEFSVAVRDNRSGARWTYNADRSYLEASLVKVPILLTLIRQATEEQRSLTAEEEWLAALMIEYSDNEATSALYEHLGGRPELTRTYELIGVESTEAGEMWGASETTARDQLLIAETVACGADWLDPGLLAFAVSLMENVCPEQGWGISAGISADGAEVALKNGWLPDDENGWNVGSAGFVRTGGADYSMVVLSSRNLDLADGIDVVEGVASVINRYNVGT